MVKKRNQLKKITTIVIFGIFLSQNVFSKENILKIAPLKQASYLCGTTTAEMILKYGGINKVGNKNQYNISQKSKGSAVAQYLCDLMESEKIKTNQPKCNDDYGNKIKVYENGKPTKNTKKAFYKGTYLFSLKKMFALEGIKSNYKRSLYNKKTKLFSPENSEERFKKLLKEIKDKKPVIIHVTPRLKRGGGHYLLVYGYSEERKEIYYIDPNPRKKSKAKSSVSFYDLKNGNRWFRDSWFWTGRYLSVNI